jgi:hypothetical protein
MVGVHGVTGGVASPLIRRRTCSSVDLTCSLGIVMGLAQRLPEPLIPEPFLPAGPMAQIVVHRHRGHQAPRR